MPNPPYGGNYNAGYATGQPAYYPTNYYTATQPALDKNTQQTYESVDTSQAGIIDPISADSKIADTVTSPK